MASPTVDMKPTLTPPASEETDKMDGSSSELSELDFDDDEDIGEIQPDHYYEGGKVPVFKPTMDQFRSFKKFIAKIDKYGMKSGIVKVIPPHEWRDALPPLDEAVKSIKVKNPIEQEFIGTHGTYRQANIEKQRSYNLPQWKTLSEESNHQPPARRGERRRNQEKVTRGVPARSRNNSLPALVNGKRRGPGRPRKHPLAEDVHQFVEDAEMEGADSNKDIPPPTPVSPKLDSIGESKAIELMTDKPVKREAQDDELDERESADLEFSPAKGKGRQPKSVSSRRKYNRRDAADVVDEAAFEDFDYRITNQDEYTSERCEELEKGYWKSILNNRPMYGADMPGSLFDDSTTDWNVARLENLLDVLGQKLPGVNTAYLYLGMWKATFAWHLEDVDLYSINYIHFGAPKQWYSISQEDARRFEAAMKNVWPNDAKQCSQFLRHKTYLISPAYLQAQYNIRVNKLVHHEGEFVITFPYGYHSGYNLGYNCAESVNFATESWLDYGRVAKKCNCEADSVWVDVGDIERKLRGEQTPEYYEETEEEDNEDEEQEDDTAVDLPTPPESVEGKAKPRSRKRKRATDEKESKTKVKRVRIRIKVPAKEPCVLCPNDIPSNSLLPTDNGQKAHRLCAQYTPETYISNETVVDKICNVSNIDKARLELKCNYCRSKRGACFQCSQKKCTRAYHATCAAAAGVQVDHGIIPVFGEDGIEYTKEEIDFRCRFHRIKRAKNIDGDVLEENPLIKKKAKKLQRSDIIQVQYYQGDIFAGVVIENRVSEQTVLIDILPRGDQIEVEYKWVLFFDDADSQLPVPSPNAQPLPAHLAKGSCSSHAEQHDLPQADDPFSDPAGPQKWAEFNQAVIARNVAQVPVDISKPDRLWYYLGKTSTEAKAQYTEDPTKQRHNIKGNFLESVKPAQPVNVPPQRRSYPASYPTGVNFHALNGAMVTARQHQQQPLSRTDKPYHYKPRMEYSYSVDSQALRSQRAFQQYPEIQSGHQSISPPIRQPTPQIKSEGYRPATAQMTSSYHHHPPEIEKVPALDLQRAEQQELQRRQSLSSKTPWIDAQQSQRQDSHSELLQLQQRQAPVANMGSSSGGNNPFRKPPPPAPMANMGSLVPNHPLTKYPYLQHAYTKQARVYQSPYSRKGGFTVHYMPNPLRQQPLPRSQQLNQLPYQMLPHRQQGPQYQTPQQFQQQVIMEAQQIPQQGYEAFFAGMKTAASGNAEKMENPLRQASARDNLQQQTVDQLFNQGIDPRRV
ncbi:MAG: hypothetical protein M1827_003441 [Pycnora praestabilis]|nr:MAG: hypothetical protein M1827_003441 [Pycnora praestabilis]